MSTVHEFGAPELALVGFAMTQANEIVFDTLASSRKAVNIARRPAAALVVGWDDDITVQIEGDARRPEGDDLAMAKAAYFREWPDGRPARIGRISPISSLSRDGCDTRAMQARP